MYNEGKMQVSKKDLGIKFMSKNYSANRPFIREEFYYSETDSSKEIDTSSYGPRMIKRSKERSHSLTKSNSSKKCSLCLCDEKNDSSYKNTY